MIETNQFIDGVNLTDKTSLTLYRALYNIKYIYFFQHWNLILDIKMVKIKFKKFVWGAPKKFKERCTRSCTLHHNGSVW